MELRTTFSIEESAEKISYNDPVMFIGSCFAGGMGKQMEAGRMPVMINPSGTVYNPVSVANTLDTITQERKYTVDDLYNHNGTWLSFNHYTDFSSDDPDIVISRINKAAGEAFRFLSGAAFLFITFGTARVYRWKPSGRIVSNCHKIPASAFSNELLRVSDIVSLWTGMLDRLRSLFPRLRVIFTVSPVRHWKDGAHGNQVSKSVLFLAIEELLGHSCTPGYFPAYELLMDDLRDYRFYDDDMLNPSSSAVRYIWQKFSDCYLDASAAELRNEVLKITRALGHRPGSTPAGRKKEFAKGMLEKIRVVENKIPGIDMQKERSYFQKLAEDR
ncbi:MAG: GSCFA domain-containing protein [Bacteroidales bacterium]|nr:GSCFA domain-containing protein [Bacteroidales bacterium]